MARFFTLSRFILFIAALSTSLHAQDYDPLRVTARKEDVFRDLEIKDQKRSREIPVRVYLPEGSHAAPVILFSHGLGGSRRGCGYLARHWSARGYAVIAIQHPGTDESVWKGLPAQARIDALKNASSPKNTVARFLDVRFVLDQLETWSSKSGQSLSGRFDLEHVGMSGHSYGAATTQGVSGQSSPRLGQRFTDKRIDAAIMFSPNRPRRYEAKLAFSKVAIPWLLMTGTKDTSPINDTTVEDRRQVYPALPKGIDKYELVLHDAQHHAFSDGQQRRKRNRNPNHHRVILALSTAFWDAHLKSDEAAKTWLHGKEARQLLEANDLWQLNVASDEAGK